MASEVAVNAAHAERPALLGEPGAGEWLHAARSSGRSADRRLAQPGAGSPGMPGSHRTAQGYGYPAPRVTEVRSVAGLMTQWLLRGTRPAKVTSRSPAKRKPRERQMPFDELLAVAGNACTSPQRPSSHSGWPGNDHLGARFSVREQALMLPVRTPAVARHGAGELDAVHLRAGPGSGRARPRHGTHPGYLQPLPRPAPPDGVLRAAA